MAGALARRFFETLLEASLLESSFVSRSEGLFSNEPSVRRPRELSAYQSTAWRRQMHVVNDQILAQSRRARGSSGEPCCLFGLHALGHPLRDAVLCSHTSSNHLESAMCLDRRCWPSVAHAGVASLSAWEQDSVTSQGHLCCSKHFMLWRTRTQSSHSTAVTPTEHALQESPCKV